MYLDLHLPSLHESYNATWDRPQSDDHDARWQIDFPLVVSGRPVGRLTIAGNTIGAGSAQHLDEIRQLLEPLETRLRSLSVDG